MTHEKNGPAQCEAVRFETGGGGGIRTLVTGVAGETVFETAAFNHSATPPLGVQRAANKDGALLKMAER